jgi:hypothetical protein
MSAVVSFVSDVVESVVDAVGDVVETVVDVVESAVETVGNVVEAVLEDPLPVLLSVAGSFIGIPPMVTNGLITAARGGDLGDIALSVGTAYLAPVATNAISSTLTASIGDAIINEAVSETVVTGISKGLVSGTISEIRGGDFEDGFAGGFTGTVVGAGVGEVSDFVSENVLSEMPDLGQLGTIAEKAVTSGITAELTGRGDFDTAFTNSMIGGAANLGANYATSAISDQFNQTEETDKEIVGAESGNVADEETIKTDLTDAWANRDVDTVNSLIADNGLNQEDVKTLFDLTDDDVTNLADSGVVFEQTDDIKTTTDLTSTDTNSTFGTGAGIPDSLVDEIEVAEDGFNTGTSTEVVSEVDTDYFSNDISGGDSLSTVVGDDTQSLTLDTSLSTDSDYTADTTSTVDLDTDLFGYSTPEDVSDIAQEFFVDDVADTTLSEVPTEFEEYVADIQDEVEQPTIEAEVTTPGGLSVLAPVAQEDVLFESGTPVSVADKAIFEEEEEAPVAVVKKEEDPYKDLVSSFTAPEQERETDIYGETPEDRSFGLKELDVPSGGLNSALTQDTGGAGKAIVTGALNQILKPAIRQGITKTLRRPVTRTAPARVAKAAPKVAPKKLSATQMAAMQRNVPAQKVDLSKLTPTKKPTAKKVDVATLSPLKDITSLSALLAGGKGQG